MLIFNQISDGDDCFVKELYEVTALYLRLPLSTAEEPAAAPRAAPWRQDKYRFDPRTDAYKSGRKFPVTTCSELALIISLSCCFVDHPHPGL